MDTTAFAAELDAAFDGDPHEGRPRDPRFEAVAADVVGFTTPAELAVLNLAARLLPAGEAYLEVGTFKGRSACAVLLDSGDKPVIAVENFLEFGMLGRQARDELMSNLARYQSSAGGFRLLEGDCFRLLADSDAVGEPVGVYFYDGAHTGLAHYLALAVVEPLLADEALVLIDDASWPMVRKATLRYVSGRPGWSVVRTLDAARDDDPLWANGLMVLTFRRPDGRQPESLSWGIEARRRFQVHVRGPATGVVWRMLHRFPGLVPAAKRLVPKRSRSVESDV